MNFINPLPNIYIAGLPVPVVIFQQGDGQYLVQTGDTPTQLAPDVPSAEAAAVQMLTPIVTRTPFLNLIPFSLTPPIDQQLVTFVDTAGNFQTGTYNALDGSVTSTLGPIVTTDNAFLWMAAVPIT